MQRYKLDQIKELKILGRTTRERDLLTCFWTGSGIEMNLQASELWVEVYADYEVFEPWIVILINDVQIQRMMLTKGKTRICVFRMMSPDVVKNVKILRDSQAMPGDSDTLFQITELETDGSFLAVEPYDLKIEFIGDSITSGEGCVGSVKEMDWLPAWMSSVFNYTFFTSQKLHAEYHVVSQCGWGFYWSWDAKRHCNIPRIYEQVCGISDGKRNIDNGSLRDWDFTSWQPDVVVVNLGTNDASYFDLLNKEGLTVSEKQIMEELQTAGYEFLKLLRTKNPLAKIVWVSGMIRTGIDPYLIEFIEKYNRDFPGDKIQFLELEDTEVTGVGARSHPGLVCHQHAADQIASFICSQTNS